MRSTTYIPSVFLDPDALLQSRIPDLYPLAPLSDGEISRRYWEYSRSLSLDNDDSVDSSLLRPLTNSLLLLARQRYRAVSLRPVVAGLAIELVGTDCGQEKNRQRCFFALQQLLEQSLAPLAETVGSKLAKEMYSFQISNEKSVQEVMSRLCEIEAELALSSITPLNRLPASSMLNINGSWVPNQISYAQGLIPGSENLFRYSGWEALLRTLISALALQPDTDSPSAQIFHLLIHQRDRHFWSWLQEGSTRMDSVFEQQLAQFSLLMHQLCRFR